ncbi:hypothetical protein T02_6241 [Trichinella nativa]|uniref:Uncharacterized protein n=1 Tax=Trichinella nativa TaxID=6335 RepID=A0A0V1KP15_9BILA|nr:hypothetical protein T02_6241 [Trichinella nativa]
MVLLDASSTPCGFLDATSTPKLIKQAQVSTHFQVRFDNFGITNSSDVTKDVKISDKDLCNTFIKLLEESRILSN